MIKQFLPFLLVFTSLSVNAQLNGVYTVDPSLAATSGNYKTIVSAVFDLTKAAGTRPDGGPRNGPNVSGPVIINIANGTYRGKLAITTIGGTTATNTVTFKSASNTPTNVIIQDTATSNADNGVVQISGCKNIIIQKVTIRSLVSGYNVFATGVLIDSFGSNTCDNVKILNCRVASAWYVNTNTNQQAAIAVRGFQSNTMLNNDTIYNCAYGIFFDGNRGNNNYTPGFTVDSCYFAAVVGSDAFQPFRINYARDVKIRYNVVNKNGCCADLLGTIFGIRVPFELSHNKFYFGTNTAGRGLDIDSLNTINDLGAYAMIYNNFFHANYTGGGAMLKFSRSARVNVMHNSFNSINTVSNFRVWETNATDATYHRDIQFVNNMVLSNGSTILYMGGSNATIAKGAVSRMNFNNIHLGISSSQIIYDILGTQTTNASLVPGLIYAGSDSTTTFNPFAYQSASNLHLVSNQCFFGTPIASISKDIDGQTRANPPTIGADEVATLGVGNNLAVLAILQPTIAGFSPGLQPIKALIRNYGNNTVTSFKIKYTVNGGTATTITYAGNLAPCDTVTITFTGANQYNFPAGASFLKVFVDTVNSVRDSFSGNDTAYLTVCSPLAGNYTVNGLLGLTGTNFQTFSQLASALNSCGVSASVNVNVAPGTYIDNVAFGVIPGNDTTKKIIIDGGNAAFATLKRRTFNAAINYVVRFDKTNDIELRNLTIQNDSSSLGSIIQAMGGDRLKIRKCILEYTGAAATSTNFNLKLIHISASGSNSSSSNAFYNKIEIDSNLLNNGYNAIDASFTNTTCQLFVRNNIINNPSYCGIYSTSNGTHKIIGNVISARSNNSYSNILIFNSNPSGVYYSQINNNYFPKCGNYAIFMSSTRGGPNATKRGEIYNNMIGGAFMSTGDNIAFYIQYSYFWDIFHNSISMDSIKGSGKVRGMNFAGSANTFYDLRVKNNSISITDATAANPNCIEISDKMIVDTFGGINYNNYWNPKNNFFLLVGSNLYNNLNYTVNYPNGGGFNSLHSNPAYISRYNLHTASGLLDNRGTPLGILTDIDGETRSGSTPDIGADEFSSTITKNLSANSLIEPLIQTCFGGSSYSFKALYQNKGNDSFKLTTDTIYTFLQIKNPLGATTVLGPIKHFNLTLKKDSFLISTFTPNYLMNIYGTYTIKVILNWSGDTYILDDTAVATRNMTNPLPVLSPVIKTVFCSNDSSRLSAGNSSFVNSYQWIKNGINISGANDSFYFANSSGKYYCRVSAPSGCWLLTDSITLNVNTAPSASFNWDKVAFCPGDSVKFFTTFVANNTYQWTLNGANIIGATDSVYFAKISGSYNIKVTNSVNSCISYGTAKAISSTAPPTASISPISNSICANDSVTLSSAQNLNYNYQWLFNNSNIVGANKNTLNAKKAGNYTLWVQDTSNKCTAISGIATVTVNPIPYVNYTNVSLSSFCLGDSSILTITTNANQVQWYKNNSFLGSANDSTYIVKSTGLYHAKVTNTITNCSNTTSDTSINAIPVPNASLIYGGVTSLCVPDSALVKADTVGGFGYSYQWIKNGTDIPGATNFNYTIKSSGNYSVRVSKGPCSSLSAIKSFSFGAAPIASILSVSQTNFCFGDSGLMICAAAANQSYQWFRNNTPISGATNAQYAALISGSYKVIVTSLSTGCNSASAAITINVVNGTFAVITYNGPTSFCNGNTLELQADTVNGSTNVYQWYKNGSPILNETFYNYLVVNSGNYQVRITKNACISNSAIKTISIEEKIDTTLSIIGNLNGCAGSTVTLSVPANPQVSFKWYKNGSWIGNNSRTQSINQSGSYYLEISSLQASCTLTTRTVVVNFASPILTPQLQASISSKCIGDSIQLTLTNVDPSITIYQWFKDGTLIPGANANNYFAKQFGLYSASTTNPSNCSASTSNTKTLTFNLNPNLIVSANKPQACEGDSIVLSISNASVLTSIEWFKDNITIPGEVKTSFVIKSGGDYSCTVVDFNGCKGATINATIVFNPNPNPAISQNPSNRELVSSINTGNQWVFNGLKINNAKGPIYRPGQSGKYYTIVTDNKGCIGKSNELDISLLFTGIASISAEDLKILPNPSKGEFQIMISPILIANSKYRIHDAQSKTIIESGDLSKLNFNLEGFASGTYYFILENEGQSKTIKIVKE